MLVLLRGQHPGGQVLSVPGAVLPEWLLWLVQRGQFLNDHHRSVQLRVHWLQKKKKQSSHFYHVLMSYYAEGEEEAIAWS
jgi:hypothetical protein